MLVACFSQDSDLLPMWNYYLKNGKFEGYNLGFSFPEYDLNSGLMKAKVIYENKEKERIIRSTILKYAEKEGTFSNTESSLRNIFEITAVYGFHHLRQSHRLVEHVCVRLK